MDQFNTKIKSELPQYLRQMVHCLFLLVIWFVATPNAMAADFLPASSQQASLPPETWVMIGVVSTSLATLTYRILRNNPDK